MAQRGQILVGSEEFRLFLLERYEKSCRQNPRYSVRAYASRLGIDSSTLSRLLNGKRALSHRMFRQLAQRLQLGPEERQRFEILPFRGARAAGNFRRLSLDAFSVISDWHHFAILELMHTVDFRPEEKAIARRMGLTVPVVRAAIERLVRLGWIEITADGRWINQVGNTTTADPADRELAYQTLQLQLLDKAKEAVGELPFKVRDQSSLIVAADPARLPEIKARIDAFRRELNELLESDTTRRDVYNLTIAFFPLTQNSQTRSEPC